MLKLRRHIALFFILCTLLVQTPKSWLHDCHSGELLFPNHTESALHNDCDICDYPALLTEEIAETQIPAAIFYVGICHALQNLTLPFITTGLAQNKAPPVSPC
ncbi:MAG: hypothetical protein EBV15_05755 [Bacteroidetes bacterium]|nr:hypothetical protein [Bacteroidota bacterium]